MRLFLLFCPPVEDRVSGDGPISRCSYSGLLLLQDLVVLAQGGQEDEGGDVFKAVDPLPTLRLLTAHVHNPVGGRRTRGQDE